MMSMVAGSTSVREGGGGGAATGDDGTEEMTVTRVRMKMVVRSGCGMVMARRWWRIEDSDGVGCWRQPWWRRWCSHSGGESGGYGDVIGVMVASADGGSMVVDDGAKKHKVEENSVETPIVVECAEDPFEELDDILAEYAHIEKQIIRNDITKNEITRNESTGNEITRKHMVVHVCNSSTVDDVLELDMLFGAARRWLEKEPPRSITTWEDLVLKFINEFFPSSRTINLRNEISNFQQRFDESFHEAWDRYKDLLRACPHHGFTELHQLDTFYNALNPPDQDSLNAAAGGNLLERSTQDVLTIIENKSKVYNSQSKPIVSQVKSCDVNSTSEIAKLTHAVNQQTNAITTAMTAMLKQFQATPHLAPVLPVSCRRCLLQMNTASRSGSLPSNTVANPEGKLKAIPTRSGLVIDGPTILTPSHSINPEVDERVEETFTDPDLTKYTIKVPPPPKMLKAFLSNKEKLQELANTPLNENCSAVILKKLPEKLRDPRKFLIPCGFSDLKCKALADLGASINLMPLSVGKKLGLPELIPTRMTLELANRAICTPAGIARDVFVSVGKPFLRTARALIDVHGEEMILRDSDERLTLNMRHDTSSYSNQPQKELVNLINIFNVSSEDYLEDLFPSQSSGNPTFLPHPELTSPEVNNDIFDSEGCNVLFEKLLDLNFTKDLHLIFHDNPLSGITTYFSNSLLEEFTDELTLITCPPEYDDNLQFDIESDLKEIAFLLYQDKILMFIDEHASDYSPPSIFDVYDDDFLEVEPNARNVYDDLFDSKGEKIKESKLLIDELDLLCDFHPLFEYDSYLIQEKPVEIITRVVQDKKLAISNASLMLGDFDPSFYEPLFFKEVPKSKIIPRNVKTLANGFCNKVFISSASIGNHTKVHLVKENVNATSKGVSAVIAPKLVSNPEPTMFDDKDVTMKMAQTLIKLKVEKARIPDEKIAQKLHDEEVRKVAARDEQKRGDMEKALELQRQLDEREDDID
nr:reverse transcriptase domain-containing protein [Tanacetum cinerariifolium]